MDHIPQRNIIVNNVTASVDLGIAPHCHKANIEEEFNHIFNEEPTRK